MEANVTEDGLRYKAVQRIARTASLHGEYFFYPVTAVNIILAITACLENALILVALQRRNSLHPSSKLMFQCLEVTDLCVGVIAQPLFVIQFASASHNQFQLCFTILSINDVVGSCLSGVSLLTLAAISVDRLLALSLEIKYKKTITLKRTRLVMISIWILNISVNSLRRFWRYILISRVTSAVVYSSLVISAFCYLKIYSKLRHHKRNMRDSDLQGRQTNEEFFYRPLNIERYRTTVSIALWVRVTMVACYLPYGIVVAMERHSPSLNIAVRLAISLVFLNSSLNPILYCWKIRGVKLAVKNIIRQLCKSCLTGKSGQDLSG